MLHYVIIQELRVGGAGEAHFWAIGSRLTVAVTMQAGHRVESSDTLYWSVTAAVVS